MTDNSAQFWQRAGRVLNAGQARTLLLTGNIHDLFYAEDADGADSFVPLVQLLAAKWSVPDVVLVVYELNGPIRFVRESDREKLREAWLKWKTGLDSNDIAIKTMLASGRAKADLKFLTGAFDSNLHAATGSPTLAFELLRQMCLCSRTVLEGKNVLRENLVIIIEAADTAVPEGDIQQSSEADRHRVGICQDWFSDPGFMEGEDSVILVTESRSLINHRIARLPQVLDVPVPAPDQAERLKYIEWFDGRQPDDQRLKLWGSKDELAEYTAGLTIHALRQLLVGTSYQGEVLSQESVVEKVEAFIKSQLGEDIVEFKKPGHRLEHVVGFSALKEFLREELIPRFESSGPDTLPGAAVCGPIGGGKTFIFEAVAAEVDMVVLVLKNIRSQWYGQTDVIFERLRRVLDALNKVMIFVDEADTQFGGVGAGTHATERRLTGKIQAMMSDPLLRGKVIWLLMTARIHLLSPDIRRPGRVGDLIIPVLDPEGEDRDAFLRWVAKPALGRDPTEEELGKLADAIQGAFSASYASLRSELKAKSRGNPLEFDEVLHIIHDHLPSAIGSTRRYQTLQALLNCTRRSLLPDPDIDESDREAWQRELKALEAQGIS